MSQGRVKKHHYVPKVLQKAFCHNGNKIWYCQRNDDDRFVEVEERNRESTFRIKDLYTVLDENDLPSDRIETAFYGPLDNYLGRILPQILAAFDKGMVPEFAEDDLATFRKAVWEMIKRTPDFLPDHDDLALGREAVNEILDSTAGSLSAKRRKALSDGLSNDSFLRSYGRDIRVRGSLIKSEKVESVLPEFDLRWARISGRHSYILSGVMAYRIGNGGQNGLINPKTEIWFPVSPKIAAVFLRDPNDAIPLVVEEPRDHVRQVNEFAIRKSSAVASHSESLLTSLLSSQ